MSDREKRIKAIDEIVKTLDDIERKSLHEKEDDKQVYIDDSSLSSYYSAGTSIPSGYYTTTAAYNPNNQQIITNLQTHTHAVQPVYSVDPKALVKMGNYVDDKYANKKSITNFLAKLWK